MTSLTYYEITSRLIGPVTPVGSTETDERRLANLRATTELVDRLIFDINEAARAKDRQEASMRKIGTTAQTFLDDLKGSLS